MLSLSPKIAVPGDEPSTLRIPLSYEITNRSVGAAINILFDNHLGDIGGGVSKEPQRHSSKRLTLSLFNHSWPKKTRPSNNLPTTFQELSVFRSSDFKTKQPNSFGRAAQLYLFVLQLDVCRWPRSFNGSNHQKTCPPTTPNSNDIGNNC